MHKINTSAIELYLPIYMEKNDKKNPNQFLHFLLVKQRNLNEI
jgi:hypothetical protein